MICRCDRIEDSKTRTASLVSFRPLPFEAFLVIPKRALCDSRDGEKNNLWRLQQDPPLVLRPQVAQGTRFVLWGHACLLGDRGPTRSVRELRQGENRRACVAGRQSVLHQTFRFLCRSSLPVFDDPRRGQRTATGLEDGQRARKAVHARAIAQDRGAWAENHRNRRGFDPKGTQL